MKTLPVLIIVSAISGAAGLAIGSLPATKLDAEKAHEDKSAWEFCVQVAYETKLPTLHVPGKGCVVYAEKEVTGGA